MSEKQKSSRIKQTTGCVCLLVLLTILVVLLLVRGRRVNQLCFVVDVLRERVPHKTPLPPFSDKSSATPFAVGTVCFDEKEKLVEWRLSDTFQFAYASSLVDARFHGPLNGTDLVAPVVIGMGLHRNTKSQLTGSSVVEMSVLADAVARPEAYYIALYVRNLHATAELEAGRSPLFLSSKFRSQ